MIADAPVCHIHVRGASVPGSLPDGTVVSSNSARCHRARAGEKSGRHLLSGGLPGTAGPHLRGARVTETVDGEFSHEPVMLAEILEVFGNLADGVFLDATLGGAGHAHALMAAHPSMRLLGLDQDSDAIEAAQARLDAAGASGRATLRRARFDSASSVVVEEGVGSLAGALFDLGVSSHQFDSAARGFSYRFEAPLDMRMDDTSVLTAHDVVNSYSRERLASLLRTNADERWASRIASAVVAARPIETTTHLAEVVASAIPAAARRTGGHPAKRTFQAVRIEVNSELEILETALRSVIALLVPGARLAVLSYHSGEDRIVKSVMRDAETGGCTCPPLLPCGCGAHPTVRRVRAPRTASVHEVNANPRARSARLRVVERIGDVD